MKILIIEDSSLMRKAVVNAAQELELECIEATNGAEGLAKLRKHYQEISLIILDWNMPIMNGFEALTKIRAKSEYKHIPILMATADGIEDDVLAAIKAGANSYLVKPYTKEILKKQITALTHCDIASKQ